MSDQRLDVFPSAMVKQQIKDRIKAARNGHSLLKRKSDAIKIRLHEILSKIKKVKLDVGQGMVQAAEAHNNAVWAAGDFNHTVIESVTDASFRIKADVINVAGVRIPKFERALDELGGQANATTLVGFSRGGEQVQGCKNAYSSVLEDLVQLAVLQTSLKALDEALKKTNRRVNALEFLIIPQLEITLVYVEAELFEYEREDSFRGKAIKDRRQAEADLLEAEEDRVRLEHDRKMAKLARESGAAAPAPTPKAKKDKKTQEPAPQEPETPLPPQAQAALNEVDGAIDRIMHDSAKEDAAIADLF